MPNQFCEISSKGRRIQVPAFTVGTRTVVVTGKYLKIARLHDEEWEAAQTIDDPARFIAELQRAKVNADVFTFAGEWSAPQPEKRWPFEWEDVAAVRISDYKTWWEGLPQESRKNVRKAEKRGVTVKISPLDDELVAGIKAIYDETPTRQGRPFWHYGKDLETVRRDNSSFLDRSDFITAYLENELIGFIKIVYVGTHGRIMQILSKNSHADKKPPNLLLAKAMEACCARGMTHFIYGQYFYGNKGHTPITEFKRRNGFERITFQRFYVPLSVKGRAAVALRLHRGLSNLLPAPVKAKLLDLRAGLNGKKRGNAAPSPTMTNNDVEKASPTKAPTGEP